MFVGVRAKRWWGTLLIAVLSFSLTYFLCLMAVIRKWDLIYLHSMTQEQMDHAMGDGGNKTFTLFFTGPFEGLFWTALWWLVWSFYKKKLARKLGR